MRPFIFRDLYRYREQIAKNNRTCRGFASYTI